MDFCTSCGVARVAATDRFCRSCGQPYDADSAPAPASTPSPAPAATPSSPAGPAFAPGAAAFGAPTGPPPAAPGGFGPPPPGAPGFADSAAAAPRRGPRPGLLFAVFGTVLAVAVGAVVAWQFLWPRGGAGSPEEAARTMVEAGASQDPLALVDVIAPAEVKGFEKLVERARDRADEEGLLGKDRLTDAVSIELSDLEFDVDDLGDDLAKVTLVGGRYDVSWDPDQLPDRLAFLRDQSESDSESGKIEDLIDDGEEPYVMTVKVDGRWYVTGLGTAAEYAYQDARRYEDVDRADYSTVSDDVDPVVGKTPEDVIENLADTISKGDVDELLASMPGGLGLPLRPYASIVEDALDGRYSDGALSLDLTVDDLDLTTDDLGDDLVKVTVEGGTFTGTASEDGYDSDTATIAIDGRCVTGTGDAFAQYDYTEGYYDSYGNWVDGDEELISDSQTWCLGGDDEAGRVLSDLDVDAYFVVMRKVDGGYQLDPVATAAEYASLALDALDGQMVDDLLDEWKDQL